MTTNTTITSYPPRNTGLRNQYRQASFPVSQMADEDMQIQMEWNPDLNSIGQDYVKHATNYENNKYASIVWDEDQQEYVYNGVWVRDPYGKLKQQPAEYNVKRLVSQRLDRHNQPQELVYNNRQRRRR